MEKKNYLPYLLMLPAVFIMAALYGYPIILTIIRSFHEVNLLNNEMVFLGFDNYSKNFQDPAFYKTLQTTFEYTALTVALKVFLGFFFAYILSRKFYLKKSMRFLVLVPWAIPQVAVSTLWKWILDGNYGYLNYYLQKFGLISENISFLSDPKLAFISTAFVDTWIGIPLVCMMFLGALDSIPKSLYEAADMDGASYLDKFKDITLPGIKKVGTTIVILVTIWTFTSFNVIYILTEGGPMRATETLIIKIYQDAFSRFNLGMASAVSVVTMVILIGLSLIYLKVVTKNEET